MRGGISRAFGLWVPPALVMAAILATLPFGQAIGNALYTLVSPRIVQVVGLPSKAVAVEASRLVTAASLADGSLMVIGGEGAPVQVLGLPAACGSLSVSVTTIGCAAGEKGFYLVDASQDIPVVAHRVLPPRGEVTSLYVNGKSVAAGTRDGRVLMFELEGRDVLPRASVQLQGEPSDLLLMDGAVLAALGDELVVIELPEKGLAREVSRLDLWGGVRELRRWGGTVYAAAGKAGVAVVDMSSLTEPLLVGHIPVFGDAEGLALLDGNLLYVEVGSGQVPVDIAVAGHPRVRMGRGVETRLTSPAGQAPQIRGIVDGDLATLDVHAFRPYLALSVGGVAAGLLVVILVWVGRAAGADRGRVLWSVVAVALMGWVLASNLKAPIEALHVLEYGLLGGLLYRALGCGGAPGALMAVCLGVGGGLLDETVQWYLPTRSGDFGDVLLDGEAAAIGVLVAYKAVYGVRVARRWSTSVVVVAALFVANTGFMHLARGFGNEIELDGLTIKSRLTASDLMDLDQTSGPKYAMVLNQTVMLGYQEFLVRFKDQPFLYELRIHLYRRDRHYEQGDIEVACGEQRVIDRWFKHAVAGTVYEWSGDRAHVCDSYREPYVSTVSSALMTGGPVALWSACGVLVFLLLSLARAIRKREAGLQ